MEDNIVKALETAILFILLFITLLWLGGCAHQRPAMELQCIGPSIRESVEGPVISKDDSLIFYDSKGKLRKITGTCGLKGE